MRIVFVGSGDFAVPALSALCDEGHKILCAVSQPPRPAGRGKRLQHTPVAEKAAELGLTVKCPLKADAPQLTEEILSLGAEIGVLADYGALLPKTILDATALGFLNIHPSLLPRWRGAAPIRRSIMAGDSETGVCIMRMNEKFDRGPVLLRRNVPIMESDTHSSLSWKLSAIGARMIVDAVGNHDRLTPMPQGNEGAIAAPKLDHSETQIDWTRPAEEICLQIRGLADRPGAWSLHKSLRIKSFAAEVSGKEGNPGEVLDDFLTVACGSGSLRLLEVQRAGKSRCSAQEFLRGYPLTRGDRLGDGKGRN